MPVRWGAESTSEGEDSGELAAVLLLASSFAAPEDTSPSATRASDSSTEFTN